MGFFELVFGFCALMGLSGMYFAHKKSQMELQAKLSDMEQGQVHKELAEIKQRLVVLERIVTDRGYSLHEEFSKLR